MKAQAYNVDFQLHTLGWKAFQDLCVTIASEILGQTVQQFLPSNDAGRDGAFSGNWSGAGPEKYVIQCKFFSNPNKALHANDLSDEIPKARRLARQGLCDKYFVISNGVVTGRAAARIEKEFSKYRGPKQVSVYGQDWVNAQIKASARLRALVPRVYGLGDLSQIIDSRALEQANELLSAIQDDLGKFVMTRSYRQAATAIMDANFVFLLGEPACGKSMAAACLSVAALDQKHARVFKLTRASEFHQHWNPKERSLFWFDDVFGPTQYERDLALEWTRYFPELAAAVRKGNRVIFTSRSYIYDAAIRDIKASAFPLLRNSQVVIRVEDLTLPERRQILYNHLKLGNQPARFRFRIKPYLPTVASNSEFKPEIARRLGNTEFTKSLSIDEDEIRRYVEEPKPFLVEVVESIDAANLGALVLLFLNGGRVRSPLRLSRLDHGALTRLGVREADVARSLNGMNQSLTKLVTEKGEQVWRFKHPTIGDAVAEVISRNPEYIDIYLKGAKPEEVLREVVCGDVNLEGAKLRVGREHYRKISGLLRSVSSETSLDFLAYRSDRPFLAHYLKKRGAASFLPSHGYLYAVSETYVICRLHELGLLPERVRKRFLTLAKRLALSIYDFSFYEVRRIRALFSEEEIEEIIVAFAEKFFPSRDELIASWGEGRDRKDDAAQHFSPIRDGLKAVRQILGKRYEKPYRDAVDALDNAIEEANERREFSWDDEDVPDEEDEEEKPTVSAERDIFDDIDN